MSTTEEHVSVKKRDLENLVDECAQFKYATTVLTKEFERIESNRLDLTEYATKQNSMLVKKVGEHEIDKLPTSTQQLLQRINKQYKK